MSRSSSLSGLGRGRARGRRDIAEGEQLAERRPGRFRVKDWEGELAGTQSDAESKWITMEYNAPSPYLGYTNTGVSKLVRFETQCICYHDIVRSSVCLCVCHIPGLGRNG